MDNCKSRPLHTTLANSGRYAGYAVIHDDYSEESGNPKHNKCGYPVFPNDHINPNELNGPVIIVQKGKTKAEKCACCGAIIPEGRQVCPQCERRVEDGK